ncbi:hypothetical protein [Embleya sp. NPDC001921]
MNSIERSVARAVFTLADPALVPVLVARLGAELAPALRAMASVPAVLADAVRASGDAALSAAIKARASGEAGGGRDDRPRPTTAPPLPMPAFVGSERSGVAESPVERAARGDLAADEVDALANLDDPHVDAALFAGSLLSDAERARLLAGVRRDGTRGRVAEPLLALLWGADLGRCAAWLAAGTTSGDPEVARVVVNRLPLRTEAGRLRVIVGVWTRYGVDEARRVLAEADFPADVREPIEDAFALRDGLSLLRARLIAEEDPERVAALLCEAAREGEDRGQRGRVDAILADGGSLPWAELIRSHRAAALPLVLHDRLAEAPDCPHELLVAMLARGLAARSREERPWLHEALAAGRVSGADLLRHAHPAPVVLSVLAGTDARTLPEWWASGAPRAEANALVEEFLGADVEAWIVAMRLFPEFTGTIPELLATARAVAADPAGSARSASPAE